MCCTSGYCMDTANVCSYRHFCTPSILLHHSQYFTGSTCSLHHKTCFSTKTFALIVGMPDDYCTAVTLLLLDVTLFLFLNHCWLFCISNYVLHTSLATIMYCPLFPNKKQRCLTFGHNFSKCRPIFKILSLADSQWNFVRVCYEDFSHLVRGGWAGLVPWKHS